MFQQSSYGGSPSPDLMLKEGNLRRVSVYMIVCRVLGLDLFDMLQENIFFYCNEKKIFGFMYLRGDLLLSIIFRMITQWFGNMVFTINLEIKKIQVYIHVYIYYLRRILFLFKSHILFCCCTITMMKHIIENKLFIQFILSCVTYTYLVLYTINSSSIILKYFQK